MRNNQQSDHKDDDSPKLEEENGNENKIYEANQNDSDLNDEDDEFNYQNGANLQGATNETNGLENYHHHQMSTNEQISAIMSAVATQNLSPSQQNRPFTNSFHPNQKPQQTNRPGSGINTNTKQINTPLAVEKKTANEKSNKDNDLLLKPVTSKSEIDLLKLLARANLTQYLTIFTEQGNPLRAIVEL